MTDAETVSIPSLDPFFSILFVFFFDSRPCYLVCNFFSTLLFASSPFVRLFVFFNCAGMSLFENMLSMLCSSSIFSLWPQITLLPPLRYPFFYFVWAYCNLYDKSFISRYYKPVLSTTFVTSFFWLSNMSYAFGASSRLIVWLIKGSGFIRPTSIKCKSRSLYFLTGH